MHISAKLTIKHGEDYKEEMGPSSIVVYCEVHNKLMSLIGPAKVRKIKIDSEAEPEKRRVAKTIPAGKNSPKKFKSEPKKRKIPEQIRER